jgi:FtsZ-interacting cell division protein ZipA
MSGLKKREALLLLIAAAFYDNKSADKLLFTEDGNCFTEQNRSHAEWHARSTKQELITATREQYESEIKAYTELADETAALKAKQDADDQESKDAKAAEQKLDEDKALAEKEALKARAIAVGLNEDATEVEIREAETAAANAEDEGKGKKKTGK